MSRLIKALQYAGLVAILIWMGWPAVDGGLIRDDVLYTVANPHVTEPVGFGALLGAPLWPYEETGLYRPLTTWSFRADQVLSDAINDPITSDRAFVSHLHNLVLNALAAVLLVLLLQRLGIGFALAWCGGLLFAAHPGRSEAVLWISGRAECLMTLFALATFLLVSQRGAGWPRLLLAAVTASAALLAKEQGATLLLLAPLFPGLARRDRIRVALVVAIGVLPWLGVRYEVLGALGPTGVQQVMIGTSLPDMMVYAMEWFGRYVILTVMPHGLRHEYAEPGPTADLFGQVVAGISLLVAAALVFRIRGRTGFGAALFVATIAPALNLVHRSSEVFAERFLALPVAGVVIVFVALLSRAGPVARILTCGGLAVVFVWGTWSRAPDYQSERSLFDAQYEDHLGGPAGTALQGQLASSEGRLADAERFLGKVIGAHGAATVVWTLDYVKAAARLGTSAAGTERDLRPYVREITRAHPEVSDAWTELGVLELASGRAAEAEGAFRGAIAAEPRSWRPAWQLASMLLKEGKRGEARGVIRNVVSSLERAAEKRPWDYQPLALAGRLLVQSGQPGPGAECLRRAMGRVLRAQDIAGIATLMNQAMAAGGRPITERGRFLLDTIDRLRTHIETARPQGAVFVALADVTRLRGDVAGEQRWLARALEATHEPRVAAAIAARLGR